MGKTPVFKPYDSDQMQLLPPSLEELITENHPARIVKKIIDQIDIRPINRKYKGGGASSYHPRMLLKVLVYGYLTNTYSSRKLEEQGRQNIHFMWLCGMKTPDHNTINRFRSEKLSDILKQIFSQIVLLLAEEGIVSLKETLVTDGTKIESVANRYTFLWGKSIKTSKERIKSQLDDLWKYAQGVAAEELKDISPSAFEQVDAEQVRKTIAEIDRALEDKQVDKKVKQKLNYARRNWPDNLERYEDQEKKMGSRNSMSRTDPDATFMRMKEDHMLNGQLKPGHNLQISTQNQFILNYSLHSNPTDTLTLPAHLQQYEDLYGLTPSALVADAGYGSDENYSLLESKQIAAYIKYGSFDQNQKGKQLPFSMEGLHYNQEEDCLYCPMRQKMSLIGFTKRTTASGFQQLSSRYQALNCQGCPLRGQHHKAQGNRIVEVNHRLKAHKEQADKLLNSEQGIRYRKKRSVDVEPVFANIIKSNHGFKRFLLKGMTKAEIEIGLLSIAHNLRKWKA